MSKRKHRQRIQVHTVSLPRVGLVTLPASRESSEPFCSWYGPHGETCSSTTMLAVVATLPGCPPVGYLACPAHYDEVHQRIEHFLARFGLALAEVDEAGK